MKEGWEAVIGMEVHAQLATATKIFCCVPSGPAASRIPIRARFVSACRVLCRY